MLGVRRQQGTRMDDVNKIDRDLRAEADEILYGKGLHQRIGNFGDVHIAGSYSMKLMSWRDLDIYLVGEDMSLASFFLLGHQVADLLSPVRMGFRNERIAKTSGLPAGGLYWGIYLGNERQGAWKIDIWAMNQNQFAQLTEFRKNIEVKLSDNSRLRILEIKSLCWKNPNYRRSFTSLDIYDAVLNHGVENMSAFGEYLKKVKGHSVDL
jgi:hypothetical protein